MSLDRKVLSCAFKEKKYMMELSNSITSKYLEHKYQWLFDLVNTHFTNPKFKEIPSREIIKEQLFLKNQDNNSVARYLQIYDEVLQEQISLEDFSFRLNELKSRYNYNLQNEVANEIFKIHKAPILESEKIEKTNKKIKEAIVAIDAIYKTQIYEEGSLKQTAKERLAKYEQVEKDPESARGILTGFKEFDRRTNGMHEGELLIVAGATGTGKSVLMHNIGVNAYLGSNNPTESIEIKTDGRNVLYFSLEMPKTTMERRIDACLAGLYYNHLRDGKLTEDDKRKYIRSLTFQEKYEKQFYIIDMPKGATVREIELKYNEVCDHHFKPDIVIVDYMGIMSPSNKSDGQDWLDLGHISAELHEFARVYKTVVITGSQVNRPKDGKNEHSTDRLARSSMIPNNANVIIQIGCRDNEDTMTDMPIHIIKLRDGEKGSFTLSKNFNKMKVIDMENEIFAVGDDDDSI